MTPTDLLIAVLGAAVIALAVAVVVQFRRHRALVQQLAGLEQRLDIFQQSLHGLTAGAAGVDKRMFRLEEQERLLTERQDSLENQRAADQPYAHAISLVQQGAGVHRLMEELELSESEAELIFRLHGTQQDR